MDLLTLRAMLAAQYANALSAVDASKLSGARSQAMSYYLGDVSRDLPSEDGRSSAVSMDVADTVEGLMPQLMEVFAGDDEVVRFEPVGPEDVEAAQQETDYVNHVFMHKNPGFMVLYSIIKDALLEKVGIVKVFWEEKERTERETYKDKTDDEYALIASAPDIEIVEHDEKDDPYQPGAKLHDVIVETAKDYSCARVMPVPPEEFGISRDARSMDDANYCYHKVVRSVADLIHDGYDAEQVRNLPTYRGLTNTEEITRDTVNENELVVGDLYNDAGRLVEITEHYIRLDYENSGKPELYRVVTGGGSLPGGGGEILEYEGKPDVAPYDAMPFAAVTPVPVTHRFFGRSLADLVIDIQKIKTALLRGALDNIYLRNDPRVEVPESAIGASTIDDLLVSRRGGIIRTKVGGQLQWNVAPDIATPIYPVLEYYDSVREWRTGVTKAGQGIDANALQNQSATAVNQVYSAAQAKVKLIARIFAETGIRDLFSLLHATIKKHADKASVVRLRNQWVTVDPRNWKTRDDLTVHVGLGDGSKMQRLAQMMQVANLQKEAVAAGMTSLVTPDNLYAMAKEITKLLGAPNTDTFFTNPKNAPPQQPQPNPEMIKAQAQLQQTQAQMQLQAAKVQADTQHQQVKMQADAALEQQKFEHQKQLALMEMAMKREQHAQAMTHAQQKHELDLHQTMVKAAAAQQTHNAKLEQMQTAQ